ncbi:hypothetical protein RhiirC2_857458 [Rhizophagus irregularis]|uniref:Alpha/beta hydrolase fold-3 domain-containing protein n=1 Tax=Rhizophagus irregularis TaxID=588596 RepID=A0A2N1MC47_9GLOM|nr:hypothetical protein RhiirC2_857458 [Rhizophagus irregularis]
MSLKFTLLSESVKTIEQIQRAGFLPAGRSATIIGHMSTNCPLTNPPPEWKNLKDDRIIAEWDQVPNYEWEKKETNARVLAISYQLTPQNQFPAALQDALAAYLYLLKI